MEKKINKVVKAGIGYTFGNYLIKGLAFLTIPLFARLLSASDYGLFNTYLAYESIMCSIVGIALNVSLKNAKYKYDTEYYSYVSSIILLNIISVVMWIIAGVIFSDIIYRILGLTLNVVVMMLIHCGCSSIVSIYNVHLSLTYSYKSYIAIAAFNAITNIILSTFLVVTIFSNNRYEGRIIGTLIPLVIISVYIIYRIWKGNRPVINKDYWRFGLYYSIPLIPHAVSQMILNQFDRIMINKIVGSVQAGIYSFAYSIYSMIEVTKVSLDSVWGPWFYEKYEKKQYEEIRKRSLLYVIGMFLFTLIVMLVSPEIIKFLGTKEYYDAVYVVVPICAAGFFSFLYTLPAQIEYYHGKTTYIAIATVLAAVLNIVLNAYFITRYGYIAAAYTTEITYILYFIFHYVISVKLEKNKLFNTTALIILSVICFLFSILTVVLIEYILLRWIITFFIMISVVFYFIRFRDRLFVAK